LWASVSWAFGEKGVAGGIFTFNDAIIMRTGGKNRAEGGIQGRAA